MGRQVRLECVFQDETESPAEGKAKAEEQVQQPAACPNRSREFCFGRFPKASMEMFGGGSFPSPSKTNNGDYGDEHAEDDAPDAENAGGFGQSSGGARGDDRGRTAGGGVVTVTVNGPRRSGD